MPNATPADVRAGWDIFLQNPDITLDAINRELERRGRGPIGDRSLRHYRSLQHAGFERYVSVNRFDVARAARPYEGSSATPRYFYYGTQLPVTVKYGRKAETYSIAGIAERVGEVGAIITFASSQITADSRPTVNTYVTVDFVGHDESFLARVIDSEAAYTPALIEVEFTRIQSVTELAGGEGVAAVELQLRIDSVNPDDKGADLIGRRIYYTLEALEAARAIANEVLRTEGGQGGLRIIGPPPLRRLQYQNPIVVTIETHAAVGTLFLTGWLFTKSSLKTGIKFYGDLQKAKVDAATAKRIEAEARRIDAETDAIRADKQTQRTKSDDDLATPVLYGLARRELGMPERSMADELSPDARKQGLVDELIEAAEGLERQDVDDIELQTG